MIFSSLYFRKRTYFLTGAVIFLFILGFGIPVLFGVAKIALLSLVLMFFMDILLLYTRNAIHAKRTMPEKFSNGDENDVELRIESDYNFTAKLKVIDEIPDEFQARDLEFDADVAAGGEVVIPYSLRPFERGEYTFGNLNVFVISPLGLIQRRYRLLKPVVVPVLPSFIALRKYEFMAISNRLVDMGIKKIRKIGQRTEFDQIKEYVPGDDFRTINWKATARNSSLMVNQFQDERSQQIYCVIDKGRTMKMPFEELTLLDYAINSSLVFSSVALNKDDRAGLLTFSNKLGTLVPASKRKNQKNIIMNALYKQQTNFQESDFARLYQGTKWYIKQRSLLMLFTNFESVVSLDRQVKYLKRIAKDHLLVVVLFKNTELDELIEEPIRSTLDVYNQVVAEKYAFEKKLIVKELRKNGIHSILTSPGNLTVKVINKYMELKARNLI